MLVVRNIEIALKTIIVMLPGLAAMGGIIYWCWLDGQKRALPGDLNTLPKMLRAFRRGSKTDYFDYRRYWSVLAMRDYVEDNPDPAEVASIAALMRDYIAEDLHKSDNRTANDVRRMLDTLAAAAPPWEANFLEHVARSKLEGWVRGQAIDRLVRLRGADIAPLLLDLLDDLAAARYAADAFVALGRAAATSEILERLRRMLAEGPGEWFTPSAAARALIALGQTNDPALIEHVAAYDPWTAFTVRAKASGLDAPGLIESLFAAGVVAEDRRPLIKKKMIAKIQKAFDSGDGFGAIEYFLLRTRSLYAFDTESECVPNYAAVVGELSKISSPRLSIGRVEADFEGEICRELRCVIAESPARITPEFMGDWTDVAAVLGGLNVALANGRHPERFVSLSTGDQCASIILGTEDGLANLVETLGLPIDSCANAPIAIGVAAERATVTRLKEEVPGIRIIQG